MAINLAEKYSPKIVSKFYQDSVILGKTSKKYDWDGVKSIKVWTINTVAPTDYNRNTQVGTASRYGATTEVEDTIQTMTITQDKSVSLSVDKGNNTQQMLIKNAGVVMNHELREQFIPMFDKYCLAQWAENANDENKLTPASAITKANIVEEISRHITTLVNAYTNTDGAYCYIGATNYAKLVLSPEFLHLYQLGNEALDKGVVGKVRGLPIIQIPDDYLPEGVEFMTVKSECVLAPTQIKDMKVHQDPPGLSGALLEVRWLYDAFVLETKNKGVVVTASA